MIEIKRPQAAQERPQQPQTAQAGKGVTEVHRLRERRSEPFTGIDASRNYRAMYRAACDFHERHNPPTSDVAYWETVSADLSKTADEFGQDPFLTGLLLVIFEELEREAEKAE